MVNNIGPSTLPCGTPDVQLTDTDSSATYGTAFGQWRLTKDCSQLRAVSRMQKSREIRSSRMLWSIVSNAAKMSIDRKKTVACRLQADMTTSFNNVQFQSSVWIDKQTEIHWSWRSTSRYDEEPAFPVSLTSCSPPSFPSLCTVSRYMNALNINSLSLTYKVLTTSQLDYVHNLISVQSS